METIQQDLYGLGGIGLRTDTNILVNGMRKFYKGTDELGGNHHFIAWALESRYELGDVGREVVPFAIFVAVAGPGIRAKVFSERLRLSQSLERRIQITCVSEIS
jgi:hypothetical protein